MTKNDDEAEQQRLAKQSQLMNARMREHSRRGSVTIRSPMPEAHQGMSDAIRLLAAELMDGKTFNDTFGKDK